MKYDKLVRCDNVQFVITITNDYHNYCDNCGDLKISNTPRWITEVIE